MLKPALLLSLLLPANSSEDDSTVGILSVDHQSRFAFLNNAYVFFPSVLMGCSFIETIQHFKYVGQKKENQFLNNCLVKEKEKE